jgi:hypothetical protein
MERTPAIVESEESRSRWSVVQAPLNWKAARSSVDSATALVAKARTSAGAMRTVNGSIGIVLVRGRARSGRLMPAGLPQCDERSVRYFAGSSQGTIGIKDVDGLASGDARSTAMAPRSAPVKECVTKG